MAVSKKIKKSKRTKKPLDSVRELARLMVELAKETKALDLVVLDLRPLSAIADYLVICSGTSSRQVQAICDRIELGVKAKYKRHPLGVEGIQNSLWVLVDYGDVICHIFTEETRGFYRLENLWYDAKRVSFRTKKAS